MVSPSKDASLQKEDAPHQSFEIEQRHGNFLKCIKTLEFDKIEYVFSKENLCDLKTHNFF